VYNFSSECHFPKEDFLKKTRITFFLKVNAILSSGLVSAAASDTNGRTALHEAAASSGSRSLMKSLLRGGGAPNAADATGETPLLAAVRSGRREAAELLVAAGADLEVADLGGAGVLHAASANGDEEMLKTLLKAAERGERYHLYTFIIKT